MSYYGLLKIAKRIKEQLKDKAYLPEAAGALVASNFAPDMILGAATLFHGTPKENIPNILKEGLLPKFSGSNVPARYSIGGGYTYLSPLSTFSGLYTKPFKGVNPLLALTGFLPHTMEGPLKIKMPYSEYTKNMEMGPELGWLGQRTNKLISPKYIKGSSSYGINSDLLKMLPNYIKSNPGRFLMGLGLLGGGTALGVDAIRRLKKDSEYFIR